MITGMKVKHMTIKTDYWQDIYGNNIPVLGVFKCLKHGRTFHSQMRQLTLKMCLAVHCTELKDGKVFPMLTLDRYRYMYKQDFVNTSLEANLQKCDV